MRLRTPAGLVYGVVMLLAAELYRPPVFFPLLLLGLGIAGLFELRSLLRRRLAGLALFGAYLAGAAYVCAGLVVLAWLEWLGPRGTNAPLPLGWPAWVLVVLFVTWSADVGAYAAGSAFGRRRITPRLSPGKTWEGTLAGFAIAALAAWVIALVLGIGAGPLALVAVLGGPAAFAGDLVESALKRYAGVKDSGRLLPGHGGVLDRIDSLLLVAPVVLFASWVA